MVERSIALVQAKGESLSLKEASPLSSCSHSLLIQGQMCTKK